MKNISGTLTGWASAAGIDRQTLARKLVKSGIKVEPGQKLTAKQVLPVLVSDIGKFKSRIAKAQAVKIELENSVANGQLHHRETIDRLVWENILLPLMQELKSMPTTHAALANPSDPKLSRAVLGQWSDRVLASIKGTSKL